MFEKLFNCRRRDSMPFSIPVPVNFVIQLRDAAVTFDDGQKIKKRNAVLLGTFCQPFAIIFEARRMLRPILARNVDQRNVGSVRPRRLKNLFEQSQRFRPGLLLIFFKSAFAFIHALGRNGHVAH